MRFLLPRDGVRHRSTRVYMYRDCALHLWALECYEVFSVASCRIKRPSTRVRAWPAHEALKSVRARASAVLETQSAARACARDGGLSAFLHSPLHFQGHATGLGDAAVRGTLVTERVY
eukprot:8676656-Alexandrium_andersonii.AAC.1